MSRSPRPPPPSWLRVLGCAVLLGLLGAGCEQERPRSAPDIPQREAQALDSLQLRGQYARWAKAHPDTAMPLDLKEDTAYRFVMGRLRGAGLRQETSPRLFAKLEALRQGTAAPGPVATAPSKGLKAAATSAASATSEEWCGHLVPLDARTVSGKPMAHGFGLFTCFGGADYAYVDITAFATDSGHTRFELLDSRVLEEFSGVVLETDPLDVGVDAGLDRVLLVDSLAIAFDESTGAMHVSYSTAESTALAQAQAALTLEHPRDLTNVPGEHVIRTCLERGNTIGNLDCDYATVRRDPGTGVLSPFVYPQTGMSVVDVAASQQAGTLKVDPNVYWAPPNGVFNGDALYLPMRGTFAPCIPDECTVEEVTSQVSVVLLERGGSCPAGKQPGTTVLNGQLPWLTGNPVNGPYQFDGLVDFGRDCLGQFQDVRLGILALVRGHCTDLQGNTFPFSCPKFQTVQPLDFHNSCLAEGTRVLRADGKSLAVERVKVGDRVLAGQGGRALTVTAVARGGERKPMVRLRDAGGGEVLMTEKHPVVTASRGVVSAGALVVGDAVRTRAGVARLVAVEREPYVGQVYNLTLGTPEELKTVGSMERTLYANGFQVGDAAMQTELERQEARRPADVLARLDPAWHQDYQGHLSRKGARR